MLGAIYEFVGSQTRTRLAHARKQALFKVAANPGGARNREGRPKLGGPPSLLDTDLCLHARMRKASRMSDISKCVLARELYKEKPQKWGVLKNGTSTRTPWSAKQIGIFLSRFDNGHDKGIGPKRLVDSTSKVIRKTGSLK
jgi:hypothetical protein